MESNSENKSNSVQLAKDVPGEHSENGDSFSESEESENDAPMNLVTKELKKRVTLKPEIDTDSHSSEEPLPKSRHGGIYIKSQPPKQKERKNKNPRPMKQSIQQSLKKSEAEEEIGDKNANFLDGDSPIASPQKTEMEDNSIISQEETMDTDSETVIAPDSVSAIKADDMGGSEDKEDPTAATSHKESSGSELDNSEMEVDIKKENDIDVEVKPKSEVSDEIASQKKVPDEKLPRVEENVGQEAKEKDEKENSGCQDKGNGDESAEKSSQKEKSSNIDAIAKKLGRQVKVNSEGGKENAADGGDEGESNISEKMETTTEKKTKKGSDKKDPKNDKKKKKKTCEECSTTKGLKFQVLYQGKLCYLCTDVCFNKFKAKQATSKPTPAKSSPPKSSEPDACAQCKKVIKEGKGYYPMVGETKPLCSEDCLINYQEYNIPKKKCSQCKSVIEDDLSCLTWETMEFCNEDCLGKYQSFLGSHCTCCQSPVQQTSLGKYCVCFGADIRQFCSGSCLEEFKKGLKVCSFCQKDLSSGTDGFLAPVGDKGQFKDFCTQQCMERYEVMNNKNTQSPQTQKCSFCTKSGIFKIQAKHGDKTAVLCSESCVAGYRYTNKIMLKICDTCYKFFEPEKEQEFQLQFEGVNKYYCSKACMTLFVLSHRKIIPCCWCKVKKYNFDMIEKLDSSHQMQTYCSLNCISLYRVSLSATSAKSIRCDNCSKSLPAQYHLTMSDGSIRNFCTYQCVVQFQNQFTNVPTLTTATPTTRQGSSAPTPVSKTTASSLTPVISSVVSLATGNPRSPGMSLATKLVPQKLIASANRPSPPSLTIITTKAQTPTQTVTTPSNMSSVSTSGTQVIREVIVKPPPPKSLKNKAVNCKPVTASKSISCKPHPCHKAVQTEEGPVPTIIPIPVPVYVPTPVHMFSRPVPVPVPFPVPVPVPIFVPLSRDPPAQIMKHLKDVQDKIPMNPFEAELLMMAEMVAENGEKKGSGANSKTANEDEKTENRVEAMESDLEPDMQETPLDVESAMPPGITPVSPKERESEDEAEDYNMREGKAGKRASSNKGRGRSKRPRVEVISQEEANTFSAMPILEENSTHQTDSSDTNLRLKVN